MSPTFLASSSAIAIVFSLSIYATAWVTAALILRRATSVVPTAASHRFKAIDGMRGVLALGVFVHHTLISYVYFAGEAGI